jgi:hypothetical protein
MNLKTINKKETRYLFYIGAAIFVFILSALLYLKYKLFFYNFPNIGDYAFEADPSLIKIVGGDPFGAYKTYFPPLMMSLSLLLRGVVLFIFDGAGAVSISNNILLNQGEFQLRFLIGSFALFFIGYLILLSSVFIEKKKEINFKEVLFLAIAALVFGLNPLIDSSLNWGHPEEFLMASLLVASIIYSLKKKYYLALFFAGLAAATKQPAVFIVASLLIFTPAK